MKYYEKPYDDEGVKRWLNWCMKSYQDNGFGLFAIELKETGQFIGDCGLSLQNIDGEILPEIGYHINKNFWRNGYAKEAGTEDRHRCQRIGKGIDEKSPSGQVEQFRVITYEHP